LAHVCWYGVRGALRALTRSAQEVLLIVDRRPAKTSLGDSPTDL
jgi:hypothetical protein